MYGWCGQIEKVRSKVGRILGVLGRIRTVVGGKSLLMLYNAMVLPHLQYCLMVWGNFVEDRNSRLGESILSLQKRLVGVITGKKGRYHSDPLFADLGVFKIGDLYRQQLRIHAWQFWNQRLPESQAAALCRVSETHGYSTRSAGVGIALKTQDQKSIGYRVPKEWETIKKELREIKSLTGFKRKSKNEFLENYKAFVCRDKSCYVCGITDDRSAAH